jgi:hypothetical protein
MTESDLANIGLAGDYNPAHIKSKIFDCEESLYRKRLSRRFIFVWLLPGNLLIVAVVAGLLTIAKYDVKSWMVGIASAALLVSIIGAVALLHRQHLAVRDGELLLRKLRQLTREYQMDATEEASKDQKGDDGAALLLVHKRYREDIPEVVESFRRESNKNRRMSNLFQNTIIIGSLLASSATTSSVYFEPVRWIAVGISLLVAVAAGFISYYKYRERSFNLQQAADSIERNYYSVELRAGKYNVATNEKAAFQMFVNEVEFLRDEQSKRQQQLEQPAEVKHEQQA